MLPSLKADYRLFEDYDYAVDRPLGCSMLAFGGTHDRYVLESEMAAWQEQTSRTFSLRMIEGGHFFVNDARPQVVSAVSRELNALSDRS
jgi:medium-chain acyl-[acyl-carrier-protein] hydrolase